MRKVKKTQVEMILDHMQKRGHITQRDAYIDYGVSSFFRRLTDIEQLGYELKRVIKTHPVTGQQYTQVSFA